MSESVRNHYERHPYPHFPLLASLRACDTYALNLTALWAEFNAVLPPETARRILIAGCGSFSPYPFSVANPDSEITALDLSARSVRRARLHCLLHGRRNVGYLAGDLLDDSVAPGPYGLIDAYGVLHHLHNPVSGLRSLRARLAPGGILRVMVYNRYARREEESIRRAFRMLGIRDVAQVRDMLSRSATDSRFRAFCAASAEADFDAGLADALLHPCVRTFRVDELLDCIRQAGLVPLRFAHDGALGQVDAEIERIRGLEVHRQSCGNFVVYLGSANTKRPPVKGGAYIMLNPCLRNAVGRLRLGVIRVTSRLGFENPPLGWRERRFLRTFRTPQAVRALDPGTMAKVDVYKSALFLLQYHA